MVCAPGSELQADGTCACVTGKFLEPATGECLECQDSCRTCSSGAKCDTCPPGFTLGSSICLACAANEYIEGDTCADCGTNCLKCAAGPDQCLECASGAELVNGGCPCQDSFFLDSTGTGSPTCKACGSTCLTCEDASKCKTCPAGLSLGSTLCLACGTD